MFKIGPFSFENRVFVAPMAGITDLPYRKICKRLGAGHAVSEMITADQSLQSTKKTLQRCNFINEPSPISAQITGSDPYSMQKAARIQVNHGANIIDINMGCPAKKVCNKLAGSALLKDIPLVKSILSAVVESVDVPVTLKTRLGYAINDETILELAQIAQDCGIQALTIHGRTREQMYTGHAKYELIAEVKKNASIPIIANGDIDSGKKADEVLKITGADAVMIGRAAQGNPWIFAEVNHFLKYKDSLSRPSLNEIKNVLLHHLDAIYLQYGEYSGCRIARKHIAWYTQCLPDSNSFRKHMYALTTTTEQFSFVSHYFDQQIYREFL